MRRLEHPGLLGARQPRLPRGRGSPRSSSLLEAAGVVVLERSWAKRRSTGRRSGSPARRDSSAGSRAARCRTSASRCSAACTPRRKGRRRARPRARRDRRLPAPRRAPALLADDEHARGRAGVDLDVPRLEPARRADPEAPTRPRPPRARARGDVRRRRSARCRSTTSPSTSCAATSSSSSSTPTRPTGTGRPARDGRLEQAATYAGRRATTVISTSIPCSSAAPTVVLTGLGSAKRRM